MSRLVIHDANTGVLLSTTEDATEIANELASIGVRFERWPVADILPGADADTVLAAYRPHLDELMQGIGAGTADVVRLTADNPNKEQIRAKFLSEHIHDEDEVRFFHEGTGNFVLHVNDRVYDARCERGDLISVPAGTQHWFDAGPEPHVTALRVFTNTKGWTPHYTGTDMSDRFPASLE